MRVLGGEISGWKKDCKLIDIVGTGVKRCVLQLRDGNIWFDSLYVYIGVDLCG